MVYSNISPKELKELMDSTKNVIIVDVRMKEEYQEGHIVGSKNIPAGEENINKLYDICNLDQPEVENVIVVVCRSGVRSVSCINNITAQSDYDSSLNVQFFNLEHGILDWVASGFELERS